MTNWAVTLLTTTYAKVDTDVLGDASANDIVKSTLNQDTVDPTSLASLITIATANVANNKYTST